MMVFYNRHIIQLIQNMMLILSISLFFANGGYAAPGDTTRVSISSAGIESNGFSGISSISADGRYVAYSSSASNLVEGDSNDKTDVFVYDRDTAQTTCISCNGNEYSGEQSMSADGRYLAFVSSADNLVAGDNNGIKDIFVHDRVTSQNTRISIDSDGLGHPSISADSRFVAFDSYIEGPDYTYRYDVYVYDRDIARSICISCDGNGGSLYPSLSAEGRYIAFKSSASNLSDTDINGWGDIFVYDMETNKFTHIKIDDADRSGGNPSISADGRYVAFYSQVSGIAEIYVYDMLTGQLNHISSDADAPSDIDHPSISDNGRVAFGSNASNLSDCDINGVDDIFVYDVETNRITRVSVDSKGIQGNDISRRASISDDGMHVAFYSYASNLVVGDNNGKTDVFVHELKSSYDPETCESFHQYDVNQDSIIGDFELLNAIDCWARGECGDFELLDLIDLWAAGCYLWDVWTDKYKAGCSDTHTSYTDNGDGTVTDNVTGFMWQQEDDNQMYNWYEASGIYDATYNLGTIDICGSSTLAGYLDWRLPDLYELMSIVDYGIYEPSIDREAFPNTNASFYWSSTQKKEYFYYDTQARTVGFNIGIVSYGYKIDDRYVRCVRGGQKAAQSFTANGDSTVTDNVTGLMWQQEDDNTERKFEEAITYCKNMVIPPSSYSDWRLPNIKELRSIVDNSQSVPAIDSTAFSNTKSSLYWSYTTSASIPTYAWVVYFDSGFVYTDYKTNNRYVRCVRGGQ